MGRAEGDGLTSKKPSIFCLISLISERNQHIVKVPFVGTSAPPLAAEATFSEGKRRNN